MLSKFLASYAHFSWLILFVFQAHERTLNSGAHQPRASSSPWKPERLGNCRTTFWGSARVVLSNLAYLQIANYKGFMVEPTTKPVTTREWLSNC